MFESATGIAPWPACLLDPTVLHRLAVGLVTSAERDQLEPLQTRLEGARHLRRDAHHIQRADIEDLIVQLDPPGPPRLIAVYRLAISSLLVL
jgi:hypothetical protein